MTDIEVVVRFQDDRDYLKELIQQTVGDMTRVKVTIEDLDVPEVGDHIEYEGIEGEVTGVHQDIEVQVDDDQYEYIPVRDYVDIQA